MKSVIMFAGKAGSGKNTAAEIFAEYLFGAEFFAFADKVKQVAKEQYHWDGQKDERGRKLLQNVGATGRAYDKDMWAKDCLQKIEDSSCFYALVTDLRFPNEKNVILSAFPEAKVILVKGRSADLGENAKDISEHAMDGFEDYDYVIDNSGSLDDLRENINKLIGENWGDLRAY